MNGCDFCGKEDLLGYEMKVICKECADKANKIAAQEKRGLSFDDWFKSVYDPEDFFTLQCKKDYDKCKAAWEAAQKAQPTTGSSLTVHGCEHEWHPSNVIEGHKHCRKCDTYMQS